MKPSDIPEQRPRFMKSIGETKTKFMAEIQKTMDRVALDAFNGETFIKKYIQGLEEPRNFFFNSMKGSINISQSDVEALLREEVKIQTAFYRAINELVYTLPEGKVLPPDQIVESPHWDHSPSLGCNIRSGETVFYAYPRLPSSTVHYLTLTQGPTSGHVIHVTKEYILMLPYGQGLSETHRTMFMELAGTIGKFNDDLVKDELRIRKQFMSLVTEEKMDQKTLEKLLEKYDGLAIQVGHQSTNIAYIHTGLKEELPRLWNTLYFEWKGNWERHQ